MSSEFTTRHGSRGLIAALCGVTLTIGACSERAQSPAVTDEMMAMTTLEGELHILARPGAAERGQTESQFDWVSSFEAETGCKVTLTTGGTAQELMTLVSRGQPQPSPPGDASWPPPGNAPFDVVIVSGDVSLGLIRKGEVFPVDVTRVPSYASIEPSLQKASWHHVDGRHYGVPFQWAPNLLLYDTGTFKSPPQSWSVTLEEQELPDGRSNKGRVQAYAGAIYIADAALYLQATRPALGIKNPYELNEAQYAAAIELLRGQRAIVQRYWQDPNVQVRDFINEGIVASGSWPFQATTLVANKVKVATTIPAEGATAWADTSMLVTGARHPNCAYKWFEWSLSPKVQGDVAAFNGSNPVVPKACENNELLGRDGCQANGMASLGRVVFWRTPEARCASHPAGCIAFDRWVDDYGALATAD
jgi:putative spermidine/putrescine transport system substrate-binding protein